MDLRGQLPTASFQFLVNTNGSFIYDGTGSVIQNLSFSSIKVSSVLQMPYSSSIKIVSISNPLTGSMYFNVGNNKLNVYNGTSWITSSLG